MVDLRFDSIGLGETDSQTTELSEDTVFEILSNRRRRYVFHYLKQQEGEVYLREVAEHVAAWELDKSKTELSSDERKNVKSALHQHHLPKMDRNGFVRYDSTRGTISLTGAARDLEVYLDVVPVGDISWGQYYLGLSAVGSIALLLVWADLGPTAAVSGEVVGVFLSASLLVSATVHTYLNRTQFRVGGTRRPPEVDD